MLAVLGAGFSWHHELADVSRSLLQHRNWPAWTGNGAMQVEFIAWPAASSYGRTAACWSVWHRRRTTPGNWWVRLTAMRRARVQALIVQQNTFGGESRERIVALAAQYRLPAIYGSRGFMEVGGLMSYGPSLPAMFRHAAFYVDRIFKGARPAICRWSSPPNSRWSLIQKPLGRSASPFHKRYCYRRMRSSTSCD